MTSTPSIETPYSFSESAIEECLREASLGNLKANLWLGVMYMEGKGVESSNHKAFKHLLIAANGGQAVAQLLVGNLYVTGRRDFTRDGSGLNTIQALAHRVFKLLYEHRESFKWHMDSRDARFWFSKAAEQGEAEAQYLLAMLTEARNYKEAITWYLKAANQDHVGAQLRIGQLYEEGRNVIGGVRRNRVKALIWYKKAASHGNQEAQLAIARLASETSSGKSAQSCVQDLDLDDVHVEERSEAHSQETGHRTQSRFRQVRWAEVAMTTACIAMLLIALARMPYDYYTLLRWTLCPINAYLAVCAFERRVNWVGYIFIAVAVIYNPIIPVHLSRGTWRVVNVMSAAALLMTSLQHLVRRESIP